MVLVQTALWLLVCLAIALAGRRLGARLFPAFPHRGAAFALPIGLVVIALPAYWVGQVSLLAGTIAGFLLLGLLALWVGPVEESETAHPDWTIPLLVFLAAFLLLLSVRAARPAIVAGGGEKFLDYSLVQAVLRAEALPPEDPWFAGKSVRYYYGGPFVVAILTEVATVPTRIAYNLALPTFYAAIATAAYGLTAAMAAARDRSVVAGGLLGAMLTAFAGPLSTPVRAALGLVPREVALEYGHAAVAGIRNEYPAAIDSVRFLATDPLRGFSVWDARYVIPDTPNVFPMWTYLNGDLRPHMLDVPFLLLVVALLSVVYGHSSRRRRRLIVFAVVPAVGGLIALMNTWSLPVVGGLVVVTLATAPSPPGDLLPARFRARLPADSRDSHDPHPVVAATTRLSGAVLSGAVVALLAAGLAAPSLLRSPVHEGIGFFPPRSPIGPFLLFHGVFVGLLALAFLPALSRTVGRRILGVAGAAGIVLAWALPVPNVEATLLAAGFVSGGYVLARWNRSVGFPAVLVLAGAGLLVVSELVYAQVYPFDPNAPRWNTVYKLYMHVWVLWAPAAGIAALEVLGRARAALDVDERGRIEGLRGGLTIGVVVVLLLSASTFGVLGTGASLAPLVETGGPVHLDGTRHVETYHPQEAPIIEWVNEREGTPTIVTEPGRDPYSWTSPLSSLTGVPTVVGWDHEIGYRGEAAYRTRARDVDVIYETDDPESRAALLRKYDVEYVYVGPSERETYDIQAAALLDRDAYSVAVRTDNATLIAVDRDELP